MSYSVSQGVNIIIPPGDFESFKWAVKIEEGGLTLTNEDLDTLKAIAKGTAPLFPLKQR